jgi:hypothetical protein
VAAAQKGDLSFKSPIPLDMNPQSRAIPQVVQTIVKKVASKKEEIFDAQMASYHAYRAAHPGCPLDPFYIENMRDILSGLQELFPGCSVSNTTLSKGTDGKFYDISTLDEKVLPFINRDLDQSFIVVDWT